MTDLSIGITTKGDVSGIKAIGREHQALFTQIKQSFKSLQERSPMQRMADRQVVDRKMGDLERKANELERKVAQAKLGLIEYGPAAGTAGPPSAGTAAAKQFKTDLERVNLQRTVMRTEAFERQAGQQAGGPSFMGGVGRAGRFTAGKALKYGGAIAGMAGAYSLFSNIAESVGTAEEMNKSFAMALSTGQTGMDLKDKEEFFNIKDSIKEFGQTAYITSKDMLPYIDLLKEMNAEYAIMDELTGKIRPFEYGKGGGPQSEAYKESIARTANMAGRLSVDQSVINEFLKGGVRLRGEDPVTGGNIAQMLMSNDRTSHMAMEVMQSMNQVLSATAHGTQSLGAFGISNLLYTINRSGPAKYLGMGGAQAIMNVDQAFRGGGGSESFQYFQNLALNPAFQEQNRAKTRGMGKRAGEETDWQSGLYDQYITDALVGLGAMGTPSALKKEFENRGIGGGIGAYIDKMYKSSGMDKTNFARVAEQYEVSYGGDLSAGRKFLMQEELAKGMGINPSDIAVITGAVKDVKYRYRQKLGGFSEGEIEDMRKQAKAGKITGVEAFIGAKSESEEEFIKAGFAIAGIKDDVRLLVTRSVIKTATTAAEAAAAGVKAAVGERESAVGRMRYRNSPEGKRLSEEEFHKSWKPLSDIFSGATPQRNYVQEEAQQTSDLAEDAKKGAAPLITSSFWEKVGKDIAIGFMSAYKDKSKKSPGTMNISGKPEVD